MSDLFTTLAKRADTHARAEVRAYLRELPEYREKTQNPKGYAGLLDYAVWFRRRTVDLASEGRPLDDDDLTFIASIGNQRAKQGFSLDSARSAAAMHAKLMLREIHAATGPGDLEDLLHLMVWFGAQGAMGTDAYLRGHIDGQKQFLPMAGRIQLLAKMLLTGDAAAQNAAHSLGICVHDHYVLTVLLIPDGTDDAPNHFRDELIATVFERYQVPITWYASGELVALIPSQDAGEPQLSKDAHDRTLALVQDCADMIGRPCSVGVAAGRTDSLAATADLARQVAQAAPVETVPRTLYDVTDVFVELGVTQMPGVDSWFRDLAGRLANGPDLVATLDAYYRNDMNRLRTAASLHLHPRTLDYRLQRVRELAELDPTSVRGVRILGTVTNRILGGAWR